MGEKLDTFLDGSPKPMILGFIGFVIACLDAGLGFIIDYGPNEPLSIVAFGIVAIGVIVGFISIVWSFIMIKFNE